MSENAYEPLLSTDETEALLQAMRNGATGGGGASAKEVELGSPDQRLRKSLSKADDAANLWAAEVRKIFRRMLGTSVSVRENSADVVPYSVIAQAIAPGAAVCVLKTLDNATCFLVLGPVLTSFVLNRRMGGASGQQANPGQDLRDFLSALDRRIVRPFCDEVVLAFASSWGSNEMSLEIVEVLGRPTDLPRLGQFEPVLRVPISVNFGSDVSEELSVVLMGDAIRAPKVDVKAPEPVTSGDKTRMVARLSFAELELVAVLGHAESTVRNVLSLRVGDVIRLNEAPTAPLLVQVEGQKKMIGVPVISHGNLAVEITQVLKGVP
jgi:flagellar motor switch protein FliM